MLAVTKLVFDIVMTTYRTWRDDRTLRLGAGLAYYGLFTVFPFFAITAALAKPVLGSDEMTDFLIERLEALGIEEAESSATAITNQVGEPSTQTSLGLIGAVSLVFAASLLFLALSDTIKTIWDVPYKAGWRNTIRRRLLSFAMVLVASFALVLNFAVSAISGAAQALVPGDLGLLDSLAQVVTGLVSWAGLAALLLLLFRFLAPVHMPWTIALISGVVCSAFLILGTSVVGWYLREWGGSSLSGAFGAVLALLTWVYAEAQILLAGVQLSKVLTYRASSTTADELVSTS